MGTYKRRLVWALGGVVVVMALLVWLLPQLLWLVPSRYVAAYVPERVQAMALPEQAAVLPTAAVATVDVAVLLPPTPTFVPPPTLTAIPTTTPSRVPNATAMPSATAVPPTATPIPWDSAVRLEGIKHHFQEWNNCGPATLAMGLSYFGLVTRQSETASYLKPDPEDRNVSPHEMVDYVNKFTAFEAISRANGDLDTVRRLLSRGMPVIIETGIDPPGDFSWMAWYGHYLLVVAYDDAAETVWVYDSWLGTTNEVPTVEDEGGDVIAEGSSDGLGRELSYSEFDRYWRQFNRRYIVLYEGGDAAVVEAVVGGQMDDVVMWERGLARALAEVQVEPENAFLWFNVGSSHTRLGNYEQAAVAFDKARQVGLPWRMLWYQFAPYEAYYELGRYGEVVDLATVTLDRRPYFEESFYYRGLARVALGEVTAGRADLERAQAFNPNFELAGEALGRLEGE